MLDSFSQSTIELSGSPLKLIQSLFSLLLSFCLPPTKQPASSSPFRFKWKVGVSSPLSFLPHVEGKDLRAWRALLGWVVFGLSWGFVGWFALDIPFVPSFRNYPPTSLAALRMIFSFIVKSPHLRGHLLLNEP